MRAFTISLFVTLAACAQLPLAKPEAPTPPTPPERSGVLMLDLTPNTIPTIEGSFGFDLLGKISATGCASRASDVSFWVAGPEIGKMTPDALSRQAIAAAIHDAVGSLDNADTMIVTHAVTEGKGPDKVCATVYGRAIRLTKAHGATSETTPP
jgi:hypothetical protein